MGKSPFLRGEYGVDQVDQGIRKSMTELLKKTINNALQQFSLDRIVLFGSRARGDASSTSDYDLLIILKENLTIQDKMRISKFLRQRLACQGIDADIILKSVEEVEYYKDKIGNVTGSALREGITL